MSRCKTPVIVLNDWAKIANREVNEEWCEEIEVRDLRRLIHDARLARELERQVSMDTECIERIRNKCYELEAQAEKDKVEIAHLQSKIDALMLEYCPDEITQEQIQKWADSQRPADSGTEDILP